MNTSKVNFDINFVLVSFVFMIIVLKTMNILFLFYYSLALLGVIYIFIKDKTNFSKQYLYVSFIYFILSNIIIKINFADILGYQDQYFYIEQSLDLVSNKNYFDVWYEFFNVPVYYRFNNWTFVHYINDYLFQDRKAILFFNFIFHYTVIIYMWKSFKNIFASKIRQLYLFIFMLFSFPLLFINGLYLKEAFYSSLLLLLFTALKNKNIFLIIFSSFFLIKIRFSYFILFVVISLFFRVLFAVKRKMKLFILISFLLIGSVGYGYISTLGNTGIKLIDYMNQSSTGGSKTKVKNLQNFSMKFLNKENLISLQNIIIIPIAGLFSPPAVRFIKVRDLRTIIESLMVTVWWWIGLPYFLIYILELVKLNYRLASYSIGIFLSIYLASSFSLITIAPEIFRYRLSIFGIFLFGSFMGFYFYKDNKKRLYKKLLYLWFLGSGSLYTIYLIA